MSVTLKWIEPEEFGDYLKKGWTEVQLHFRPSGKFLIASPEEPASDPAKVETVCQNCGENYFWSHARCCVKPDHPEPVAAEMPCPFCGTPPEIKSSDPGGRSEWIPEGSGLGSAGWIGPVMEASCRVCGVMRVPLSIWNKRAQAAEAGKVRMPKVRELLDHLYTEIGFSNKIDVLTQAAFAALDAVEGKGEGRG